MEHQYSAKLIFSLQLYCNCCITKVNKDKLSVGPVLIDKTDIYIENKENKFTYKKSERQKNNKKKTYFFFQKQNSTTNILYL